MKVSGRRMNGDPTRPTFVGIGHEMPDASSYPPGFNYRHPVYLRARAEAFARSRGICQGCGQQPAVQAHHWALQYPPAQATTVPRADRALVLSAIASRPRIRRMAKVRTAVVRVGSRKGEEA